MPPPRSLPGTTVELLSEGLRNRTVGGHAGAGCCDQQDMSDALTASEPIDGGGRRPAQPISSSLRSVAGQLAGGELAGGIISGRRGVETGGVTMMPAGGDGATSAAAGASVSV